MAQTLDDLDRALAEADSLLGGASDDLDSALAEADRLLAAPDPRPSLQGPSRRATPPAVPAPPVAPRASGRPAPAPRAPSLLGVERGGRLTLPGGASATDLAVIQSSPAQMSLRQPDPFARRPQAPAPSDTLGAPDVSLPARAVGGAMNLGQAAIDAVPAGATGFTAGTLGTAASVAGTVASATYAQTPEEARLLSLPAAKARADFAPSPEYSADILDDPGVMLDPRFWGYMTGQLAGSVASLAGTGAGGRVVGAAAASKLAARAPALASKLAQLGGAGAATAGESLVEAADAYQTVLGDGKTPEEAAEAAARVFSANAVLLGLTNHPLFEAGGRGFRQVLKRAVSEGGQEASQTMAANVATDRPLSEGVGTAALMGAVGGPVAGAILDGPADRADGPVAPPAQDSAPPGPVPAPSVGDRIREAIAASEAARKASSFEATPAAAGAPNADLDVVLAEADAVLQSEGAAPAAADQPAPPVVPPLPPEAAPDNNTVTDAAPPPVVAPPPAPPAVVDIPPPPAQTGLDVAAGPELGEGAGAGGGVPRRRDADFRPQGRAQRARHLDHVFADVLADARDLDPAVDDAVVRREYDARVELFEELNAEAREAGGDPRDLLREIARLGGIDELDNGKGQHGELQRLREGQGGAVDGIKGVFRRRQYDNRGVPSAGLPLDVMLQRLQQDPRWRNLDDLNDLVDVIDDVQRGNFKRLDLLPGYDRAIRELGMRPGERWWDDPIFPPDAGAVVGETATEDDLDAAVNEADVVLGETVDDSFDPADFETVLAEADSVLAGAETTADDTVRTSRGRAMPPGTLRGVALASGERVLVEPIGPDGKHRIYDEDGSYSESMSPKMLANEQIGVRLDETPVADTLDTGEQQTRLPGEVGAVRDEERAQPTEAVPEQSLRLTATEGKATQSGLFGEAPPKPRAPKPRDTSTRNMFGEDDLAPMATPKAKAPRLADLERAIGAAGIDQLVAEMDGEVRYEDGRLTKDLDGRSAGRYDSRSPVAFRDVVAWLRSSDPDTVKDAEYRALVQKARAALEIEEADDDLAPMTAYHGSPHVFEKFSLHKIGTGEGAQAYGWGLYFASMRKIAEYYRATLSNRPALASFRDGLAEGLEAKNFTPEQWRVIQALEADQRLGFDRMGEALSAAFSSDFQAYEPSAELVAAVEAMVSNRGALYRVDIPEHGEYLDWDKPLSEQNETVRQFFETTPARWTMRDQWKASGAWPHVRGRELYRALVEREAGNGLGRNFNEARAASERLAEAGIPGIQYRDSGSRHVGDGSYNYVVFDDALVNIEEAVAEMAKPRSASAQLDKMRAAKPPAHQKGRGGGLAMTHQRRPGTKTIAETPKNARPSDIVRAMSELLKTPVGVGRLITSRALGYYHKQQNAIRVKVANDLPVLMHEFGHAAERHFALNWADPRWNGELLQVGAPTSLPSYTLKQRRAEGVAEFWRLWVMAPQQAQAQAPAFYRAVEARLDELGELGKGLRSLQKRAQAFLDADPMARVHLRIDFDSKSTAPDGGSWVAKAATRWVDDLHTLRQATEAMAGGAPLPPTLNAYLMARNARGAMSRAADFLDNGVRDANGQFMGPSLRAALQPVHDALGEFAVYLVALRARELHQRRIQTGLTDPEVNDTIRTIEAGPNAARFAKARDGVYEFQSAMLTYAREAGVLSAGQQAAIHKLNQYYVPFQRMLDAEVGQGTGRRIADRMSPVKKIKGSGRDIVNPLESIIKNAFTFVDTVEKNRAMQALTELADRADERKRPGSGGGQWLRRIKDPQTVTGVRLGDVLKEAAEKAGAMWMSQSGPSLPPELEQMLDDLNIDLDQVLPVFQTAFSGPKGEQIVTVLRDGKRHFYEIENPMLYQAITMISPVARDGDLKLAELMARVLRSGATLTLGFITRNPGRDTLSAFLQSRHGFIPVADTLRGAVKVLFHELGLREDEEVAQFWAQGITQATLVGMDRDVLRKKLRQLSAPALRHHVASVVRNPLELLQALSAFSEVSTRMGEFSLALRQGGKRHNIFERLRDRNHEPIDANTLAAATLAARDVTTDFSRGGSKAKEWNQTRAFFNARVQGYARIVETVRTQPQTTALNVTALAAAAIVFRLLADDDDDYRELAEWEKLTYWHWRPTWNGERADFFVRIPKPFEWSFAPNAVEAALDYARDRKPEAFNLLKAQVKENARTLVLGAVPTWIMPAVEAQANYSFFRQAPIVSPWDTDLPLEQQASDWTSQTARGLAKLGLPLAPAQIDHLLYGYTAGLGRAAVTGLVDPALRKAGLAPPAATAPAPRWEDTPAIGSLVRSAAPRSDAESIREFYEAYREMTGTLRGYNKAKADPAQQGRILDGVKRQRWRGREDEMKAAKKQIDDLADEIDKVYADPSMTPQQKTTSLEGMRRALVYEARVGLGYESTEHVRRRAPR